MRLASALLILSPAWAQTQVEFARDIAPILQKRCVACHGPAVQSGALRLDAGVAASAGGKHGKPIVPGNAGASRLVRRITGRETPRMPPTGDPLTDREINLIRGWIDQGATGSAPVRHWAFITPRRPSIPSVHQTNRVRNPIDAFVLARLEREGLTLSREADPRVLIRRLSFDFTGLPPKPEDVDAFVKDSGAYEKLVDHLLESPHFGEKWARHWLDLARYADSDGYETDQLRPHAWRYRHWVVEVLNRNLPFDRFTIDQIAGDLLPGATLEQRLGTGFHRNTLSNREGGADLEEYRVEQVVDRVATVGLAWMGLTVGCARCHDHKYDPISQKEFYQLYAIFNSADEVNVPAPFDGEWGQSLRERPAYDRKWREAVGTLESALDGDMREWERRVLEAEKSPGRDHHWDRQLELIGLIWEGNLGGGQLEGLYILKTDRTRRTTSQQRRLFEYFLRRGELANKDKFAALKVKDVVKQLDALAKTAPPLTLAPVMFENPIPKPNYLHTRGDFRARGMDVAPGTPAVLPSPPPGRLDRLAFARWLVSRDHPLTARVTVNRYWQELFGAGLVLTSEDFGTQGARPSHPELLDWLAVEFIDSGWDTKKLLKTIVMSSTYRQSSAMTETLRSRDPNNRLLARQSRLRLPAELVRDCGLTVSGLLSPKIGGPSVRPPQPEAVTKEAFETPWVASPGPDRYRRGLYTWIQRTAPFAQSVTFDAPDPVRSCSRRERSNTPLQALTLLNDPVFVEMAQALAERTLREHLSDTGRVDQMFLLCLGRPPKPPERDRMMTYLAGQRARFAEEKDAAARFSGFAVEGVSPEDAAAWAGVASIVLNLDEFFTRE